MKRAQGRRALVIWFVLTAAAGTGMWLRDMRWAPELSGELLVASLRYATAILICALFLFRK